MLEWLESIAGPQFVPAVLWTLAVLVALVAIVIGIRTVRRASSGTFVAGGRSRKTRLAVMDATAVDSHRRLVLVRRDDVEHLLLIGGASDIVVEPNIRLNGPIRRPQPAEGANHAAVPRPRPPETHANHAPQPQRPPVPQPRPAPQTAVQRTVEPRSDNRVASGPVQAPTPLPPRPAPAPAATTPVAPSHVDDIDETLLHELEVSLDDAPDRNMSAGKRAEPSLEEEMTRLLGELSNGKK